MMKKWIWVLALCMLFLCACDSKNQPTEETTQSTTEQTTEPEVIKPTPPAPFWRPPALDDPYTGCQIEDSWD